MGQAGYFQGGWWDFGFVFTLDTPGLFLSWAGHDVQRSGSKAWGPNPRPEGAVGGTGVAATDIHQLLPRFMENGQEIRLAPLGLVSNNPNAEWISGTECVSLEELLISYSLLFRLNTRQQNLISQHCEIAVRENWRAAPHFQRHYEMVPVALAAHFAMFLGSPALPV